MKIFKFFKGKTWLIALFILIVAFSLRLIAALKIAWRPDEIVYVDWIGNWFSTHFWSYLFQFYHSTYPPESNIFGNPPLAMWIMTIGIIIAKKIGISVLLGARLINVIIGSIVALYLFNLGRKWFNLWVGVFAGLAFALLPVIVTNNGTAYLETLLCLLVVSALDISFRYISSSKAIYLYLLGLILGLSLLVKFVDIPFILGFLLIIPIFSKRTKLFWRDFIIFMAIIILTAVVFWSGFRDWEHIKSLYMLYSQKLYSPYQTEFPFSIFKYYYLMLIGILPPIIIIGLLLEVAFLIRNIIQKGWQKFKLEIILVFLLILYIAYNSLFTRYGASHQLLPLIPLIVLLAALGFQKIIRLIRGPWQRLAGVIIVIVCLTLPLAAFRPAFWDLYASSFVGGADNAFHLYSVGLGGEGVGEIAKYLNENTPKDSRTAIVGYDWILKKYLKEERSATPLFLKDGLLGATGKAAEYVVVPRPFMEGKQTEMWTYFAKQDPIYKVMEKGIIIAQIYKIDFSKVQTSQAIKTISMKDWDVKKINNTPNIGTNNSELIINYSFDQTFSDTDTEDSRILLMNKNKIVPGDEGGIFLEIYGDGNVKYITTLLLAEDKSYLYYDFAGDWYGWKKIYIPFQAFNFMQNDPTKPEPNFDQKYTFNLGFLAKKPIKGQFGFRNMFYASYPEE